MLHRADNFDTGGKAKEGFAVTHAMKIGRRFGHSRTLYEAIPITLAARRIWATDWLKARRRIPICRPIRDL